MIVRWTRGAAKDLEGIAEYLHENAPSVATRILKELYTGTMDLASMPYLGRPMEDGRHRRLLLAEQYLVTYRIERGAVHVLRIRHTSRKPNQ